MEKHKKTFYLKDGKTFKNLKDFAKELSRMSEEVYKHHVTPHKNDFANWIRHSLKEEDLALKIDKEIDKIELELETLRHLVHNVGKKTSKSNKKKEKIQKKQKKKNSDNKKQQTKKGAKPKKKSTIKKIAKKNNNKR